MKSINDELFKFIEASPTAFHAISNIKKELSDNGFEKISLGDCFKLKKGGKYFFTKNDSSIIALTIGKKLEKPCLLITASHSDSPAFKLKENATITLNKKYTKLNTEGYGGMLCATFMDRPLSIAGRVMISTENGFESRLVNIDRDLLMIPNVAIHFNREVNKGFEYNLQKDMLPLFSEGEKDFDGYLAKTLKTKKEDIIGKDLFVYSRMKPIKWGADNEFISAPRLDDLQCAFSALKGFLEASNDNNINVYACFDNEEVGSGTKQGALSDFMSDVLKRTVKALGLDDEFYSRMISNGFMLSCDNAHAVHPNHPEKTDETNNVYMNEGVVLKSNASQKYTTDAISSALLKTVCKKAGEKLQFFSNRSDAAGGSTLGNLLQRSIGINSADIGLPQLAMHSAFETAGGKDTQSMINIIKEFYNIIIVVNADKYGILL